MTATATYTKNLTVPRTAKAVGQTYKAAYEKHGLSYALGYGTASAAEMVVGTKGALAAAKVVTRSERAARLTTPLPKSGSAGGAGTGSRYIPQQVRRDESAATKDRCRFCGRQTGSDLARHLDHEYPHSRGGDTTSENIQTACAPCNQVKGARTTREWLGRSRIVRTVRIIHRRVQ